MGKIFISHSSANNAEALAIHDWLSAQGWGDVFLDLDPRRGLVAGDRWQAALKAAAEQCELILILISPQWAASRWCLAEFLLAKQMNKQILGAIVQPTPLDALPVELTAEWQLVDLSATDPGFSVTLSPPRFTPETTVAFSGTGLARLSAGLEKAGLGATTFTWPPASDPQRSPFRGLKPLDADDAGIFFGRDGALVLTMDRLRGLRAAAAPRFATILGASGAGKSSFLRAGILPRLARDSQAFTVLPVLRPERAALTGDHGLAAILHAALAARGITRNRADLRDAVRAGESALRPILAQLAAPADSGDATPASQPTLVLAIDQAEELLAAENAEGPALLALLATLTKGDAPPLLIILTVRSDAFDALQSRAELAATQPHLLIDLPPVAPGAYGDIIRGPAQRASAAGRKLTIAEPLVDALLADMAAGGTKDALPLLSFTLERLFTDYGADGDLGLDDYRRLGGLSGAMDAAVEQALSRADANAAIPRDRAARLALLRRGLIPWLAGIDPATGAPRRRVARLAEVPEEARPLIDLLVAERLLSTDRDAATGEQTIEPAHEALLRQWAALGGWLAEDAADLSLLETLRRAATDWEANARAAEFLVHTGGRLQQARDVAANPRFAAYLTSIDRAYLEAATAAETAARRRAAAQRQRLQLAGLAALVILVIGATASWFLYQSGEAARRDAAASFAVATSEAALRAGAWESAASAARTAYTLAPSTATRTAFFGATLAISPHALGVLPLTDRVVDIAWRDAEHLALLTGSGALPDYDLGMHRLAADPAAPAAVRAGLAPDGEGGIIAIAPDGSLTGDDGAPLAAAPSPEFAVKAGTVVAASGGRVIAMVGLTGEVLVRDCRARPCADLRLADDAQSLALSSDGATLAIARKDGTLALSATTPSATPSPVALPAKALALAFTNTRLVVATDAPSLLLIDPANPATPATLPLESPVSLVASSPDGQLIARDCGSAICLTGIDGAPIARIAGHTAKLSLLRFSPTGEFLVSAARGEAPRLWSVAPIPGLIAERQVAPVALTALAVDRAQKRTILGDQSGALHILTPDAPSITLPPPKGITAPVASIAILADHRIAAVYQNKALAVWRPDATTPDALVTLANLSFSRVAALTGDIAAAMPLSDKSVLVLTGPDLRQARVAPGTLPLDQWGLVAAPAPNSAIFSYSDGALRRRDLAAGGEGALLFDPSAPLCNAAPTTDNNGARSLALSADGKWLTATRTDATLIVHNLADPAHPVCLSLPSRDSRVVAFSPDGTRVAVLGATDRLSLFDLSHPDTPILLEAPAVPESLTAPADGAARRTAWLDWADDSTLLVATTRGTLVTLSLDEKAWASRLDSLATGP